MKLHKISQFSLILLAAVFSACTTMVPVPGPNEVTVPEPIADNSGKFLSPYKADGSLTEWAEKWAAARVGADVGTKAGQTMLGGVPFFGDSLAKGVGVKAAIKAVGGLEFMKETSDLSFENVDDLIVYIYARHSHEDSYIRAFEVVSEIYPDVKIRKARALLNAEKE